MIEKIYDYLMKQGPKTFEEIWEEVKETYPTKNIEFSEKANTNYLIVRDVIFIMIGNRLWDIREKYTQKEISKIKSKIIDKDILNIK